MSSVKKIAKSPKSKARQSKAETSKSGVERSRTAKRGAALAAKKARGAAARTSPSQPKAKAAAKRPAAAAKAAVKPARSTAGRSKTAAKSRAANAPHAAKAKVAAKARPATKSAAAKVAARPTTKPAPARKAASGKRVQKVTARKTSKTAKPVVRAKAGAASAPRMVRAKSAVAAPRRTKASVQETVVVAQKAAAKLAEHTDVRLALRPLPDQAAAPRSSAGAKAQTLPETIETSDHPPVSQKTQKKASAAAPSATGSVAPAAAAPTVAKSVTAPIEPIKAAAEKRPIEKPQVEKASAEQMIMPKPQPLVKEAKTVAVKPGEPKPQEVKPAEKPVAAASKPAKTPAQKPGFKPMEYIVYPAHGVGQIIAVEEQEVAGFKLELFVISFVKDKMILKVPTPKSVSVGMRKLAGPDVVKRALGTLTGRARVKRTMWSRRAQEYEAKINSGDLVAIAEVVRDLYRSDAQPEQSYSERQLYEAALDRVAREIAVVEKLTETESLKLIESQLQKGPRRSKGDEGDTAAADVDADDGDIDEAA